MAKEVCVILPALDEENTIGMVIDEIPREEIERRGYEVDIVVIDNGSIDRTGEIARERGAQVVVEPTRGKGMAIRAGFEALSCDFVFILDADYTYPATYIPEMLEVLEGGYDVVTGSRLKGQMSEGAMSNLNLAGNRLLALMTNILYGTRISDPCTGCWGLSGKALKQLKLNATGFDIEANMLTEVAMNGCRITEIPISYRRRSTPPKLKSLRDGFKIGKMLVSNRFRPR